MALCPFSCIPYNSFYVVWQVLKLNGSKGRGRIYSLVYLHVGVGCFSLLSFKLNS